jgi:4-methyl-5(b-hydroxyethyl)-thiazole monophosphate biosynthesis
MAVKAIVLLAEGFEDVEAATPIDYLRRAGAEVTVAAVGGGRSVRSSRGLVVVADALLADLDAGAAWDAVVLPGGLPGAANLAASPAVRALALSAAASGRLVAAICAAPAVALQAFGLLAGRRYTCAPGKEAGVADGTWSDERVVVDGNIVTSRGAGTAGEWAAAIVACLFGPAAAAELRRSVLLD